VYADDSTLEDEEIGEVHGFVPPVKQERTAGIRADLAEIEQALHVQSGAYCVYVHALLCVESLYAVAGELSPEQRERLQQLIDQEQSVLRSFQKEMMSIEGYAQLRKVRSRTEHIGNDARE
jgi:hypothetical protein